MAGALVYIIHAVAVAGESVPTNMLLIGGFAKCGTSHLHRYDVTYTACLSSTGKEACAEDGPREKKFIIPIFNRCDVDLTMKLCTVLLIVFFVCFLHRYNRRG
ncbi:unnamed protein product [Durusdinium trenchii]|uniref:Uncharacterized protein n=1 Tax=Durusdinium trenchii TaxID=1381693 RepID=A0ABP0KS32_9DINO